MNERYRHLRSLMIAITALAFSAGLAFGATPPAASWGLANAATHAGKTVPVAGADEETLGEDDETTDEEEDTEESEDVEGSDEAGDNCATDPTTLTEEQLAEMNHGSVVCWAAQQTEWPEWFSNHGAFVKCWAHQGKADATSCTEDPNAEDSAAEDPTADDDTVEASKDATSPVHGKGNGKGKGKSKHQE